MASKSQRAVTGVPPERWARFGRALETWREDVLGYKTRVGLARDSGVNIRLLQDLEKNYRPGTYTKWTLQDAARAYQVPYCPRSPEHPEGGPGSILAFLRGEEDALARAEPAPELDITPGADLLPSPFDDPARTDANEPYAAAIWGRLPRRPTGGVTDAPGPAVFPAGSRYARLWDDLAEEGMVLRERAWFIADLQRRADDRNRGGRRSGAAGG